jgi:D-Ala-D-Ala ligase-like protein
VPGPYSASAGYARLDFRVDSTGASFIIDVNPNPYLSPDTEDAAAAAQAGLSYQEMIASIVESSPGFPKPAPDMLHHSGSRRTSEIKRVSF